MKRIAIIIALLWAATAEGFVPTCPDGLLFCNDDETICTCYDRPNPIERKVEWGYQVIRTVISEWSGKPFPELVESIEIGLREDGVVVWRKVKEGTK